MASTWLYHWYLNFFPIKAKSFLCYMSTIRKKTMLELGVVLTPTRRCGLKDMEPAPILTSSRNWKNTASFFTPNKKAWLFQSITEMKSIEKYWELFTFCYISQRDFKKFYVLTELIQLHLFLQFQLQDTFASVEALWISNCFIFHCQTLQHMGGAQRLKSL